MKMLHPAYLLLIVGILAACSQDADDRIEGKWQLREVEANGVKTKTDTVFYNFQNVLFMYQVYHPGVDTFSHCYGFKKTEAGDQLLLELITYGRPVGEFLLQTDWAHAERRFTIEQVSTERLILSGDGKRYHFRRF
jgi:hypothetical protein